MIEPAITTEPDTALSAPAVDPIRGIVFALLSIAFLVWVAFGQVEARVWVAGKLTILDRPIAGMWRYLGTNLPNLPATGLISMLFWLSISFVVIGTIAGLWLFLCTPDDEPHDETWESIHAAHLHHESN